MLYCIEVYSAIIRETIGRSRFGGIVVEQRYSVLMSVYEKESPKYLRAALQSILKQTLPPYEIILVCDGPLTTGLEQILDEFSQDITLVRLSENNGLGKALAEGLHHCSCEWIARMDSDDISASGRCEKQLRYIQQHPEVDILSGTLAEFAGNALDEKEAERNILAVKRVPETNQKVAEYIKFRNPINHPCVMFRRQKVMEAGNYQPCHLFEDYDLWIRMYKRNCVFANLDDTILYMRVNEMHRRRGGLRYAKEIFAFWTKMYRRKIISAPQYICVVAARVIVSLLPNYIRKVVYDRKLRDH